MEGRLEGKIALITGGTSGMGRGTVDLFVDEGAKVVVADIQDDKGALMSSEFGSSLEFIHCDVSQEAESTRIGRADLELLGRYAARNGRDYCQQGCNLCDSVCPAGVAISEVLRTRMYDVDYGDRPFARDEYAKLAAHGLPS